MKKNIESIKFALEKIEEHAMNIENGIYRDISASCIIDAVKITAYTESIRQELNNLENNL